MQFMILFRRRTEAFADDAFAAMAPDEVRRAKALYREGFVRQIWHRGDTGGACMLVEAESMGAVQAALATLPMVAAGMLEVSACVPLEPYRGFL